MVGMNHELHHVQHSHSKINKSYVKMNLSNSLSPKNVSKIFISVAAIKALNRLKLAGSQQ